MESKKTIVGFLTIVIVVLLGFAVSLLFYSNNDNSDNSPSNTQQLSTGNSWYENFYDKPITDKNIALNAIEANRDRLGYNNENISFEFTREDKYLGSYYRFKILYKQIPIKPSTIIVTTYSDNTPDVIVSGNIDLSKLEKLNTIAKVTQDEALNIAKEALGENFSQYNILRKNIYPELIIYETNEEYVLTYYINTGTYICVINAENGDIVNSQSTLCDNVAEYEGQNGDNQEVFYDDCVLDTFEAKSVNFKNALYNKEENIFIYNYIGNDVMKIMTLDDIQSGNNKSAVDAMANTYKSVDYFKKNFQQFFDTTKAIINYDKKEDNASGFTFIDKDGTHAILQFGTRTDKKEAQYSAYLDIVAHEYTHTITDLKVFCNGYSKDSKYFERNALMEAYSDIFGQLIEQEYTGKTDWKFNKINNSRNLKNPKIKKYSERNIINDIGTEANDYGGAHENSTIISHTAYLMSKNNNNKNYNAEFLLDYDQLGKLWYGSLDYLDETSDFLDCRLAIEKYANKLIEKGVLLEANLDIIKQAFDEVGTIDSAHGLKDALKVADN